jgi:phosphoenolpyruvate synthase/pyruvate phosphate dikinase
VIAEKSGVLFTVDPIRGRAGCMVIEAAHGLGESIVSGEAIPDHYVVSRFDRSLVDEFLADTGQRVLRPEELEQLASLGLRLEDFFGSPQDVEWSIRGGDVLLLQSRPITTLGQHV